MEKNEKLHIEKNTIQETLVIPLLARKKCTQLFPSIYKDTKAIEIINRLDYDFESFEKKTSGLMQSFGSLEIAMRQLDIEIEIKEYLKEHPQCSVVNLGCGLDQSGELCDNGKCKIYNIDLPDVIEVRNSIIPPEDRVTNIGCDITDTSWFSKIDASNGVVFFAAGVFYYLKEDDVHNLVNDMGKTFKGGKLVLDTCNKTGLKMMLKTVIKQSGIKNIEGFFHIDDNNKDISYWLKNAKASKKGYMNGYINLKEKGISPFFRLLSRIGDKQINMQIIRFDFIGA